MSSSNSHVGPKFTLDSVIDVDSYRARRIHDEDAPKIVELGQAWSELGPRPIVKSFSSEAVKKKTKLPRIPKKNMGRAGTSPGKLPAPGDSGLPVEELDGIPEGDSPTAAVSPGGEGEEAAEAGGGSTVGRLIIGGKIFFLVLFRVMVGWEGSGIVK